LQEIEVIDLIHRPQAKDTCGYHRCEIAVAGGQEFRLVKSRIRERCHLTFSTHAHTGIATVHAFISLVSVR
jgi:hypothetical protein